jgi:copper oxidase (laccase) domain-containing protein
LRYVALAQLLAGGVDRGRISFSMICTFENPRYFSYRRDHPPTSQLQVGYLMRK